LTSVDQKRAVRLSATAGQRRSERTVTGHHRHIIDVGLRIAAHAKALRILISEIEAGQGDPEFCREHPVSNVINIPSP